MAQAADLVATGTITAWKPGVRGKLGAYGRMSDTTDQVITIRIERVIAGEQNLTGAELQYRSHGADGVLSAIGASALVFLVRDGADYRLVFNHSYGAFPLFEPGPVVRCEFYSIVNGFLENVPPLLSVVEEQIRIFRRSSIKITAHVPTEIHAGSDFLPVRITYTNTGPLPTEVLPPSSYSQSIWVKRLRFGQHFPHRYPGKSLGDWGFLAKSEDLRIIPPGTSHDFKYEIPSSDLGILQAGKYAVDVKYAKFTIAAEKHYKENVLSDTSDVWLGIPLISRHPLTVSQIS